MKTFYIYKITNLVNGKIYIGKTDNIKKRWNAHKTAAKRKNPNDYSYLHRAMNKYGTENFLIEQIKVFEQERDALEAEINFIAKYNSTNKNIGYNLTIGGDGISGFTLSDETKKKISEIKKATYIGENNPFYGKHHSLKTIKIISEKAKQKTGEKNPFFGKEHSEESIQKMKNNHFDKEKYFSEKEIEEMIYKKKVLKISYKAIAKEYGVYWKTISNAVNGRKAYSK